MLARSRDRARRVCVRQGSAPMQGAADCMLAAQTKADQVVQDAAFRVGMKGSAVAATVRVVGEQGQFKDGGEGQVADIHKDKTNVLFPHNSNVMM